jgi:hypothetical protein
MRALLKQRVDGEARCKDGETELLCHIFSVNRVQPAGFLYTISARLIHIQGHRMRNAVECGVAQNASIIYHLRVQCGEKCKLQLFAGFSFTIACWGTVSFLLNSAAAR